VLRGILGLVPTEWLIAGLFVATFGAIVFGVLAVHRESERVGRRALREAAARFGLRQAPRTKWSGARAFSGKVRGFEVTWTLTPRQIGRDMRVRVSHPNLAERRLREANPMGFPLGAELALEGGVLELTFKDTFSDDAGELVSSTHRLLALASRLGA